MYKYEDFKGTASELFDKLIRDGYVLFYYPEEEDTYAFVLGYEHEATKDDIKNHRCIIDITYEDEEIIEINSYIRVCDYDDDEDDEDDYEYDDFEARHDGSYLWD